MSLVSRPVITQRDGKTIAVDWTPAGPFLVITNAQVRGLIYALADAGWIYSDGFPMKPGPDDSSNSHRKTN